MNRKLITALLILFVILAMISSLALYYAYQSPLYTHPRVILYSYNDTGTFNYVANLMPNTIYDNRTTLEAGQGPIFTKITKSIGVNFTYTFKGSDTANLTLSYNVSEYFLGPLSIRKQIGWTQGESINASGASANLQISDIPPIRVSTLENLATTLSGESGFTITEYNATITIQMNIEARTSKGSFNELFTPWLSMEFASSFGTGNSVSISDLQHSKTGELTRTDDIYQPGVKTQRDASFVLSVVSFPGLLIAIWAYFRGRPPSLPRPEALIEEVIDPFKEVIAETDQEPQFKENRLMPTTTVSMKTLEDLVKVADTIAKPIIHTRKPPDTHIFYVVDEATRYEYTITETTILEKMKEEEQE
jgi:hypothetical protein